ncbi:zinc knuckle CX2CX4HX4C containing protein, partial [Tanacetum coccineum]
LTNRFWASADTFRGVESPYAEPKAQAIRSNCAVIDGTTKNEGVCCKAVGKNIEGNIGKDGKARSIIRSVPWIQPGSYATSLDGTIRKSGETSQQQQGPQSVGSSSFVSVLNNKTMKKVVKIKELRNDTRVEGAAVAIPFEAVEEVSARFANTLFGYFIGKRLAFRLVENYVQNTWAKYGLKRVQLHEDFFLFQFDSREGMESVLENGPWLIRNVPLILNVWSPNTDLKKAEVRKAPVWVKLHHVPIVAYSEIGLSLITTQLGKPIMLDSYTSTMCLSSWGRSTYARALIEVSADKELMESLTIAIPVEKDKVHTLATIEVEYEWSPPRCSTCLIFDQKSDKCPKLPKHDIPTTKDEEGFVEVRKKKNKNISKPQRQVDGIQFTKPPPKFHYRRVEPDDSSKPPETLNTKTLIPASKHVISVKNSFDALESAGNVVDYLPASGDKQEDVLNLSDSEVDEEIIVEKRKAASDSSNKGASTPIIQVS